jgi:hypothetical protein
MAKNLIVTEKVRNFAAYKSQITMLNYPIGIQDFATIRKGEQDYGIASLMEHDGSGQVQHPRAA